jgi:hypothetical protein
MKGFFLLSTYDLIEAEYSTEFNKASFPGFKGQFFVKTRDVFDTRFFAYHFHKTKTSARGQHILLFLWKAYTIILTGRKYIDHYLVLTHTETQTYMLREHTN